MTGPGTNTYLVGIDEIVVIDPGPDDAGHLDAIAGCGGDRIRWIVCTHTHIDHFPGVAGLKAAHRGRGARVRRPRRSRHRPAPRRRRPHRSHRVRAPRHPHAGARLQPPLLPARAGAHALLRRPHHGGLHRRHPAARRRHGGLPPAAGTAEGPAAAAAVHRAGPRAPDRASRPPRSTSTCSTGRCARARSSSCCEASGPIKVDDIVAEALHGHPRGARADGRRHGLGPPPQAQDRGSSQGHQPRQEPGQLPDA